MNEVAAGVGALVAQDGPRAGHERSNSDIAQQAVLPLLKDYTEQANSRCEVYLKARMVDTTVVGMLLLTSVALVAAIWVSSGLNLPVRVAFAGSAFLLNLSAVLMIWPRLRLLRHGVHSAARRLERVVRFASQFADHAVVDVGDRLALEVRIGEAEAALEQAKVVLSSPASSLRSLHVSAGGIQLTFEPQNAASSKPTEAQGTVPPPGQRRRATAP